MLNFAVHLIQTDLMKTDCGSSDRLCGSSAECGISNTAR